MNACSRVYRANALSPFAFYRLNARSRFFCANARLRFLVLRHVCVSSSEGTYRVSSSEGTYRVSLIEGTFAFNRAKIHLRNIDRSAYAFLSFEGTFAFLSVEATFAFDRAYACSRFIERIHARVFIP